MRCKKKANYIFKDFRSVLIFCFVLYQDKMKAKANDFQTKIYLIIFHFLFAESKANKNNTSNIIIIPLRPFDSILGIDSWRKSASCYENKLKILT